MKEGREVVIVEAARTPVGRGHKEKGYYKDVHPHALLGAAYRAVIERSGIDPNACLVGRASGRFLRTSPHDNVAVGGRGARKAGADRAAPRDPQPLVH